jgi:hypothetical protein
VPAFMVVGEGRSFSGTHIPLIILSCKVCGNVRSFARKTVLAWLEAHPE